MEAVNENSKIRGVVFDLDHTLFDRYATLDEISYDLYKDFGDCLSADMTREEVSRLMIEGDSLYVVEGWDKIYAYLREKGMFALNADGSAAVSCEEYLSYMLDEKFPHHAVAFDFTEPMLRELKAAGVKTGLLTNSGDEMGHMRQYGKLGILGITDLFDEIIVSSDAGIHKPDRRIFDLMTEKMGIPAENMLYVGDNPINDVEGSKNAGYIPVWVRLRECVGERADCEYSVSDVSELSVLIDKINSVE